MLMEKMYMEKENNCSCCMCCCELFVDCSSICIFL